MGLGPFEVGPIQRVDDGRAQPTVLRIHPQLECFYRGLTAELPADRSDS